MTDTIDVCRRIHEGAAYLSALSVAQDLFGWAGFALYDPNSGLFGVGFVDVATDTFVWKGAADCWADAAARAVDAQRRLAAGEIKELH